MMKVDPTLVLTNSAPKVVRVRREAWPEYANQVKAMLDGEECVLTTCGEQTADYVTAIASPLSDWDLPDPEVTQSV